MKDFCVVMKKERRKAYIALAWVSFFWGTTYLASKISAQHIPGLFVAGVRQFVSGLLLVAYFKSQGYAWPDKKSWAKIGVQAFFLLCISNGLLTWAMDDSLFRIQQSLLGWKESELEVIRDGADNAIVV